MSHRALLAAAAAQGRTYVEDVFSAYPYAGTGASQAIANGIDLTKGGLVWTKSRSTAVDHLIWDTARGSNALFADTNAQESNGWTFTANSNGYGTPSVSDPRLNQSGINFVSWAFQKAKKFFDGVTWTGDGTSNRQIPHALGIAPGMVTAKRRDSTGDWAVWHRSATGDLYLDTTAAQTGSFTQITAASTTTFSVSGNANISGATYVAYAWAHDPDTVNGIVQCGTYTEGSSPVSVTLGWEPQYVLVKAVSATSAWNAVDTSRGMSNTQFSYLSANSSSAEAAVATGYITPTATGFTAVPGAFGSGVAVVYLAIRRGPMRTPTSGTSVYNAIARTGTGAAAMVTGVGFAPDLVIGRQRASAVDTFVVDRLRGRSQILRTDISSAEPAASPAGSDVASFDPGGISFGSPSVTSLNSNAATEIDWLLARAPQFLDIVCYKGTGSNQTLPHNLGTAPGMMWIKDRSAGNGFTVYHAALGAGKRLDLTSSGAATTNATFLNSAAPTAMGFTVGVDASTNSSGDNYVAYLFGALPGVSSIGSYTGNGATQTINCGFASGARFVLIKRTDAAGDWIVLDTVRGIIVGNDPYLALDTTTAEVTTSDLLTPQSVGFVLTSNALVNANGGNFIYFAVA